MDDLTQRLSVNQPVVVGGPNPSLDELGKRLEMGYVFIKFTETRGGTDLNLRMDQAATDLSSADLDEGSGTLHVEGLLILNNDPVRCIADIDVATLKGTGHLVLVPEFEVTGEQQSPELAAVPGS